MQTPIKRDEIVSSSRRGRSSSTIRVALVVVVKGMVVCNSSTVRIVSSSRIRVIRVGARTSKMSCFTNCSTTCDSSAVGVPLLLFLPLAFLGVLVWLVGLDLGF